MDKTARIKLHEKMYVTRAQKIENLLNSSEAIYIWKNCYGYRYNRILNTRLILRVKCTMLWEMAAELNKLNQ